MLFLKAFSLGDIYYDPAIKLENAASEHPDPHRRNQFRVRHGNLTSIYRRHENVVLKGGRGTPKISSAKAPSFSPADSPDGMRRTAI